MTKSKSRSSNEIIILCEGTTEKIAVDSFFKNLLKKEDLGTIKLRAINLKGKTKKDIPKKTQRYYLDEKPRPIAVFTLIDLYGFNIKYGTKDSLGEKVDRVTKWLRDEVKKRAKGIPENFFHPHVSVHEIEAWFFAEGKALKERLGASIKPDPKAEEKNFDNPPKKRINRLFRENIGKSYREKLDASSLFKNLNHNTLHNNCFYYRKFYDDLVNTAGSFDEHRA